MAHRLAVWLLAVGALIVLPATGALAHASGQLPHARLSAEGEQVVIEWSAAPDDAVDIGIGLGLMPEEAMLAYLGGPVEDYPTEEEIEAYSRSPQLRAYLLDNVEVTQDGRTCAGEVEPAEDFSIDGARFAFTCPEPVETVDVRITLLHDRDERYVTYSVDGTLQDAVHTSQQPEHEWDFTLAGSQQSTTEPVLYAGLGGVALALLGVGWWLRPRSRRRQRGAR